MKFFLETIHHDCWNNVKKNLNSVKIYKNSVFLPPATILHVSTYIIQYESVSLGAAMEIWSA
jgi:hypothetical protein